MTEKGDRYNEESRGGAVRIIAEIGKPVAQVARDLGVNEGSLGNWVATDREAREGTEGLSSCDIAELKRLRAGVAELAGDETPLRREHPEEQIGDAILARDFVARPVVKALQILATACHVGCTTAARGK